MHDPLLVHRREPGGQLPRDRQGLSGRQPAPVQARAKRLALEELGDEVRRTLVRADVVDRQHVRVVQGPGRARLALEALPPLGRGHVAGQHLDRDVAAEAAVASAVHLAHSPGTDGREDLVDAEASADRQAHRPRLGDARVAGDMPGCRLHGRLVEEPRELAVVAEQRLHLPPERLVTLARRLEERPPLALVPSGGLVIEGLDPLPAAAVRQCRLRRLSSRSSHAFASFQSRSTVCGETPRTSAVSSARRPPK